MKHNQRFLARQGFLAGAAAGLLNGLFGAGGGTLLVPLLRRQLPDRQAHAASVAVMLPVSLFSVLLYSKEGFSLMSALPCLPLGLVGAAVGARLLPHISQPLLRRIFSLLILLSALRLWFR